MATRLVNRIGKVLRTGKAYELRDIDGTPISIVEGRAYCHQALQRARVHPERQAPMPPGGHRLTWKSLGGASWARVRGPS